MDFIKPTEITDALYIGSDVPENDYQEWNSGTSYAVGDNVIVDTPDVHTIFECLVETVGGLTPDLLNDGCADMSDWTNIDFSVGVSEVDPAGQFRFDTNTGAAPNASAGIQKTITSPPNTFTIEAKTYFDALGAIGGEDSFSIQYSAAAWRIYIEFGSDGLFISKAGGSGEVGSNIVKYGATAVWQTWRFQVNKTTPATATVEVFLKEGSGEFVSQGTVDCDWELAGSDGLLRLNQQGSTTNDMVTHVDYIKIATGLGKLATTEDTPVGNSDWLEVSATNRWACFDGTIGNQTEQATALTQVLMPGAIDSVALLNIESTTVDIIEIDDDDDLVTNGSAWTDATGTTQPTGWDKVGTPANFNVGSAGQLRITTDAVNEGISQTITVSAATEYQLLGTYRNTAGDIAQIAIRDVYAETDILAITDLPSSIKESIFAHIIAPIANASGTVTRANTKISAVDGTAFVDFSAADILTDHVPYRGKLTVTDSTGKKLVGYIKAAGTGETLSSELITSWVNGIGLEYETLTVNANGHDIDSAINSSGSGLVISNTTGSAGMLNKIVADITLNSGTAPIFYAHASGTNTLIKNPLVDGTYYYTYKDTEYRISLYNLLSVANYSLLISQKQVLTPSATGVTITSTAGGSTYNWESKEAGFNYNDASGYTYTIEPLRAIKISLLAKSAGDIVWFDDVRLAPTEYSETVTTGANKTDLVKLDIPQKANGILTVKVNHTTGTAKLGELIVGIKTNIGTMRYSPSIGITDYSTKAVDVYGHYSIVPRTFAKRMTCSLIILNTAIDEVIRLLTLYRSTELVWVGDANYNSLIVYGYYKDFQVVFARPNSSDCSLEIEGLT